MTRMEIDDEGLDSPTASSSPRSSKFASGPVGVAALAAVLAEEVETIEDVYEPFLLRLGFWTGRRRAASRPRPPASTSPAWATRSRRRAEPNPRCRPCGTTVGELTMEGSAPVGWALVVVGVIIVIVRAGVRDRRAHPFLGHLPGDIVIQRDNVAIFIPLGSMLLVSVVVSIVLGLLNRR